MGEGSCAGYTSMPYTGVDGVTRYITETSRGPFPSVMRETLEPRDKMPANYNPRTGLFFDMQRLERSPATERRAIGFR